MARWTCTNCKKTYKLTEKNTHLANFVYQPWFNYCRTRCPGCTWEQLLFVKAESFNHLHGQGIPVRSTLFFADEELVVSYSNTFGLKRIQARELTPHEEREVAFFAYLLERQEVSEVHLLRGSS